MHVVVTIDSLAPGGAERSLVELLPGMTERGVEVDVVTAKLAAELDEPARRAGATTVNLGCSGRRTRHVALLRQVLRQRRPDLVHTTLFESNVAGRVAAAAEGVPVVSSLVNTPYGADHRREPGLSPARIRSAQALDALTARLVWRFHANAADVGHTMARRLGLPAGRMEVIPRGRDALRLGRRTPERHQRVRAELELAPADRVVVAVARHEPNKGLDVLLDAVGRLVLTRPELGDRLVVLVAGREGTATPTLNRQVEAIGGGRVRLLGVCDDVGDLLAAADCFVLPSRREGFPGVVAEALALEVPIVVTAVPGTLEALGEGTGTVVAVDDPAALAEAVAEVLDRPDPARVAAGRHRFETELTVDAVAAAMVDFYRRAAAGPPPPGWRVAGRVLGTLT